MMQGFVMYMLWFRLAVLGNLGRTHIMSGYGMEGWEGLQVMLWPCLLLQVTSRRLPRDVAFSVSGVP